MWSEYEVYIQYITGTTRFVSIDYHLQYLPYMTE